MKPTELEPLSPDMESLFAAERAVPSAGEDLRVRALLRARGAPPPGYFTFAKTTWLGAAALTVAAGAGAATYAWSARGERVHESRMVAAPPPVREVPQPDPEARSLATTPPATPTGPTAQSPSIASRAPNRRTSRPKENDQELTLLQPAQAAMARGNMPAALEAIDEHERRYPSGQLSEEREALRVKALSAMGRRDDARRAASAFGKRFPGSVLLPPMTQSLLALP